MMKSTLVVFTPSRLAYQLPSLVGQKRRLVWCRYSGPLLRSDTLRFSASGVVSRHVAATSTSCLQIRSFSSRRKNQDNANSWKNLYALPFSISPEEALQKFRTWAIEEQGLNYLIQWQSIRIGAAYCPVWSFDLNVRFVRQDGQGLRYDWKPEIFAVYGNNPVIFLPGLSAYAGYSYRRSLIHPVHSTSLVFLGDDVVPFGSWMLRDMQLGEHRLSITPDPWNATRGRAFSIVRDDLEEIARTSMKEENANPDNVQVQTQVLRYRRVYMPTYVIEYKVFGVEYRAFISGCDEGVDVSGVSHKVLNVSNDEMRRASNSLVSGVTTAARTGAAIAFSNRQLAMAALMLIQFLASTLARVLVRIPIIGLVSGIFVGFKKVIQPWMGDRWASAEWERQREHEAYMEDQHTGADFVDTGAAERYFQANRDRILRSLSGQHEHDQGNYNWYADWEKWARHQWEQQQRQQQQAYGGQYQRQQQQRIHKQKAKPEYKWDFDPNDPYSVLGIKRGATKSEVSAAFRKQMLMYHPDVQPKNASEAERERANERSKLITEAYRKIKAEMK